MSQLLMLMHAFPDFSANPDCS